MIDSRSLILPVVAPSGRDAAKLSRKPSMNDLEQRSDAEAAARREAARKVIGRTNAADYDGHTAFVRMTPAERLRWLDQAVLFIESRKKPAGGWQVAEDPPEGQF